MAIQILLYIYNWHIQRNVVHKIHIYVCYMQLYMCVCDEQYFNDYNNTTQN